MDNKIQFAARIVLGLIFFVFGGMGLGIAFGLIHMPFPPMPAAAQGFMKGMLGTGYFFQFLKLTETTCGFLLLTGIATPLVLVIIAPVTINIVLFNAFLMPSSGDLVLPLVMAVAQIIAMSAYWKLYQPLFAKK